MLRGLWLAGWLVGALWLLLGLQWWWPELSLWGIRPRSLVAPQGLLVGHFIHAHAHHLAANSIALLLLWWLLLTWSAALTLRASGVIIILASALTWVLGAAGSLHLGASGLVFGYCGFILGNGCLRRSLRWLLVALLIALIYGGSLYSGMVAAGPGVSWLMHTSGFVAGIAAAWQLRHRPR